MEDAGSVERGFDFSSSPWASISHLQKELAVLY